MKKHLIALAVASAVAVPAIAQQVSVSGTIDMGVRLYDTGAVNNQALTNDQNSTTRLRFGGSEDLGGGLKAEFMYQASLDPNGVASQTAGGGAVTTNSNTVSFNEEMWVGLSGSFGHVRAGRSDLTGLNGLDSTVGLGNHFNSVSGSGEIGNNVGQVVRYISPVINGFRADIGYGFSSDKADTTKDKNEGKLGVLLSYTAGPLALYAGRDSYDDAVTAGQGKQTYEAIGATYNFGSFSVGLISAKADTDKVIGGSNSKTTKQNILNVKVPLGNGLTLAGAMMNAKSATANDETSGYSAVLIKDMSKRTALYAQYTEVSNKAAAKRSWAGTTQSGNNDQDPNALVFGIRHNF